jgi:hypothetical protein
VAKPRRNKVSRKQNNRQKANKTGKLFPRDRASAESFNTVKIDTSQVSETIKQSVEALLLCRPFLLPRALPTPVYSLQAEQTFIVDDCAGFTVEVEPKLFDPIRVIKTQQATVPNLWQGTFHHQTDDCEERNITSYPKMEFMDANGQNVEPNHNIDKTCSHLAVNDGHWTWVTGNHFQAVKGSVASMFNEIIVTFESGDATFPDLSIEIYDADEILTSSHLFTKVIAAKVCTYTVPAVIGLGSFWTLAMNLPLSANYTQPIWVDMRNWRVNQQSDLLSDTRIPAVADEANYNNIIAASTHWSITSMALLITNTQADLKNGGIIGAAVLPSDKIISHSPKICYTDITNLPYNKYTGKLANGAHVSMIGEKVQDYFFKDKRELTTGGPSLIMAGHLPSDEVNDVASLKVVVRINYELILPSICFPSEICSRNGDFFNELMGAIRMLTLGRVTSPLVGENPDHIRRIKEIAIKLAKDPRLRQAAMTALKAGYNVTKVALPVLMAAL